MTSAVFLAFFWPDPGAWLRANGIVFPMVMAVFVCQGANMPFRELRDVKGHARSLLWGAFIAHGLAPVIAWLAVSALGWQDDRRIGLVLMACMAPTLVSGVVIATQARGHVATAVLLTVILNLLAILTIPFNLRWTLGEAVPIDHFALLRKLLLMIFLPAVVGQYWRRRQRAWVVAHKTFLKQLPVVLLGLIVYASLGSQVERLRNFPVSQVVGVLLAALLVHYVCLATAFWGGVAWFGIARDRARSLAIVCSQKTIPVATAVWLTVFADNYPLAIVPPILFHLGQVYSDGVLARIWGKAQDWRETTVTNLEQGVKTTASAPPAERS